MRTGSIQAIDHVNLEVPPDLEEDLAWFYGEVAELEEIAGADDSGRVLRFRSEQVELRLHVLDHPQIDQVGTRVCLTVSSLREAGERLAERAFASESISGIAYTDRKLAVRDPAGHRIELKQWWPEVTF